MSASGGIQLTRSRLAKGEKTQFGCRFLCGAPADSFERLILRYCGLVAEARLP